MTEIKEIPALIDKARKYLRSARVLQNADDFDSAASRLYYAMFYCATAVLLSRGFSYKSHQGVVSGFGQHFANSGEMPAELHRWLIEGFALRQSSDYEALSTLTVQDACDLQIKSEMFVETSERWLRDRALL